MIGFEPEILEVEIIMVTTVNDTDCTLDTNYVNEQQRKKTREQQELLWRRKQFVPNTPEI